MKDFNYYTTLAGGATEEDLKSRRDSFFRAYDEFWDDMAVEFGYIGSHKRADIECAVKHISELSHTGSWEDLFNITSKVIEMIKEIKQKKNEITATVIK